MSTVGGVFTLIQASDGNLWGTNAGVAPESTLYTINIASGSAQTVLFPCTQAGVGVVAGSLIQGSDGKLYGVGLPGACGSPTSNSGVIYSIDAGLPKLPNPSVSAVTNGASFAAGMLVGGEIATAFGTSLTTGTGINLSSLTLLPGSRVGIGSKLVNGCPATPLAVDNVRRPAADQFSSAGGNRGTAGGRGSRWSTTAGPAPDGRSSSKSCATRHRQSASTSLGNTYGATLHADYTLVTPIVPATASRMVLIYCTALGAVSTAQMDGTAANGESTLALPTVTIGGASAMVTFSGLAPGFVGLNQVNVMVPSGLASGKPGRRYECRGRSQQILVLLPVTH